MRDNDSFPKKILPISDALAKDVAIDPISNKVFVSEDVHWNPLFQTWLMRNKRSGILVEVVYAAPDEISALRDKGMRVVEEIEVDQAFLKRANAIVELGARYMASDIHINMRGGYTELQFEVDGELRHVEHIKLEDTPFIVRAIYQGLAGTKEGWWKQMECQDAQIPDEKLPPGYNLTSARIVRGPSYPVSKGGGFMTIRLQYSGTSGKSRARDLPKLEYPKVPDGVFPYRLDNPACGLSQIQLEKLDRMMSTPNGAIILTGPTGGGKTTLIFECLKEKARTMPWRRQVWVEDPTELPALWAVQMYVPGTRNESDNGEAYGERGRTALRMAPKTIMFGELRGASVALAFFRACQTGHDGWTTIHSNDPFQTVERIEMLDPKQLNRRVFCDPETVRSYVGVRLLPVLCEHCRVKLADARDRVKPRVLRDLETWGSVDGVYLKGPGCPECSHAGTKGRKLIMEIVLNDEELAHDFVKHGVAIARRNYRKRREDACPSLLESAVNLALAGVVDPLAIEDKVTPMRPRSSEYGEPSVKKKRARAVRQSLRIVRRSPDKPNRPTLQPVEALANVA
jgi:general secretion pathway protein E